jgi:hypothetical protein
VFAAIDRMRGMVQPKTGRQKAVTARWTAERRHEEEGGEVLAWRLRVRPQKAVLLAPRTAQDAAHNHLFLLAGCEKPIVARQKFNGPCVRGNGRMPGKMLKKAGLLTRPTLAVISPTRPESAKTDSSPWDAPYPVQGRSE